METHDLEAALVPDRGSGWRSVMRAAVVAVLPAVALGLYLRVWMPFNWAPECGSMVAQHTEFCLTQASEAHSMLKLSRGLVEGEGWTNPVAWLGSGPGGFTAPAFPTVMALGQILGFDTTGALRALSGAIGAIAVGVVGGVTLCLDRRRRAGAAALGAALAAVMPWWIEDTAMLRPGVLLIGVLSLLLGRLARLRREKPLPDALQVGVLLGVATLTRADVLLFVPAVLAGLGYIQWRWHGVAVARRSVATAAVLALAGPMIWMVGDWSGGYGLSVPDWRVSDVVVQKGTQGSLSWLTEVGWVMQVALVALGVAGVVRRRHRSLETWPFIVFAIVSGVTALLMGLDSSALVGLDVACIVLGGSVLCDGAAAISHRGGARHLASRAANLSPRIAWSLALLLVFTLAFAVRFGVVHAQRTECGIKLDPTMKDVCWELKGDTRQYLDIGRSIASGDGFAIDGRPSANHPPLFPLVVAGVMSFTGGEDVQRIREALCLVGALGVAIITAAAYRLGRLVDLPPVRVATWAGGIAIVYPAFWLSEAMLLSESLLLVTGTLAIWAAIELCARPSLRGCILFGGAIGLTTLTRAEGIMIVVPVGLAYLWAAHRRKALRAGVLGIGLAALVVVATIAPWIAYNQNRFSSPVFLTSTTGVSLAEVACDEVFYGDYLGYYSLRCIPAMSWFIQDEAEGDALAMEQALEYLQANLARYPVQIGASVARATELYRPAENARLSAGLEDRGLASSFTAVFAHLMLLPLAFVGVRACRRRGVSLAPFAGAALAVFLAVSMVGAIVRFRLPVDISIVLLGAVGLVMLQEGAAARPSPPAAAAGVNPGWRRWLRRRPG